MPFLEREEQTEYQREWMARRRASWLREHGPCARCGSVTDLQVDHIDPTTKISHAVWSWSNARREAELSKCQALCRPCHVAKTSAERRARVRHVHGTPKEYQKYKCRCGACSVAYSVYRRRWRACPASFMIRVMEMSYS